MEDYLSSLLSYIGEYLFVWSRLWVPREYDTTSHFITSSSEKPAVDVNLQGCLQQCLTNLES
jgi:hypothetical protein